MDRDEKWYAERRKFLRMPTSIKVQVREAAKPGAKKREAVVADISPGGARLHCNLKFRKGMRLILYFLVEKEVEPVDVEGKVMWCSQGEGPDELQYGIQFIEASEFEKLGDKFLDYLAFRKRMEKVSLPE